MILFMSIPKVASRSLIELFASYKIITIPQHVNKFPECIYADSVDKTKIKFSFAFVRNPYDRIVSCWTHSLRQKWFKGSLKDFIKLLTGDKIKKDRSSIYHHSRPQFQYTHCKNDQIIDFIGKQENQDLKTICEKIFEIKNIKIDYKKLRKINASNYLRPNNASYKDLLDNEDKEKIDKMYGRSLELYDYSF